MDAEKIGMPKDYMSNVKKVANYVGLRMPETFNNE